MSRLLGVTADWHELVVRRRIMQPSAACDYWGQLDPPAVQHDRYTTPQSATLGLYPVARRLLLINRPWRDGRLSWHWYTAATGVI